MPRFDLVVRYMITDDTVEQAIERLSFHLPTGTGVVLMGIENQTPAGWPATIKGTDTMGNVAFITSNNDGKNWSCALSNGISASFSYAGVKHDNEQECKVMLSRAKSPEDALKIVKSFAYANAKLELI